MNLEFLQSELKRVSEWIQFSDKKSAFLSVYYSAILGFLFSQRTAIFQNLQELNSWISHVYFFTLPGIFLCSICGVYLLFRSVFPRLDNKLTDKSLFYFGHVANMKFADYSEAMKELSEENAKKQIEEQIYTNSIIANSKMKNVCNSTKFLFGLIVFVIILIFFFL